MLLSGGGVDGDADNGVMVITTIYQLGSF